MKKKEHKPRIAFADGLWLICLLDEVIYSAADWAEAVELAEMVWRLQ